MPITRCRVVCGLAVTIETFWPRRALISVDLPTFGAPTSATYPHRVRASSGVITVNSGNAVSDRILARFFRSNANDVVNGGNEDLAVANLSGFRGPDNSRHDALNHRF